MGKPIDWKGWQEKYGQCVVSNLYYKEPHRFIKFFGKQSKEELKNIIVWSYTILRQKIVYKIVSVEYKEGSIENE